MYSHPFKQIATPLGQNFQSCLQEEVLARILGLLQPCQLHWVERVNQRLRNSGAVPINNCS